ncbi:MAG: helix-turn-helix transcriptional regulator [Pseudoxanthomonas sp.]
MEPFERIRTARLLAQLSQARLAQAVGVQRSAVSHWESPSGKRPNVDNLRRIAVATGTQFEWLATGRGPMVLSREMRLESVAAVDALLVDDPAEYRLVRAYREVPQRVRMALLEVVETLAQQRTGRPRLPRADELRIDEPPIEE